PPDDAVRQDHELACRTTAIQILSSTANTKTAQILSLGNQMLQFGGMEHEWRRSPVGWLTGFAPVEFPFVPMDEATELGLGQAVTWIGSVACAANADTVLVTPTGPEVVTPPEGWPVKRIKAGGPAVDRPDILVRTG